MRFGHDEWLRRGSVCSEPSVKLAIILTLVLFPVRSIGTRAAATASPGRQADVLAAAVVRDAGVAHSRTVVGNGGDAVHFAVAAQWQVEERHLAAVAAHALHVLAAREEGRCCVSLSHKRDRICKDGARQLTFPSRSRRYSLQPPSSRTGSAPRGRQLVVYRR